MAIPNAPLEALPLVILATLEIDKMVEIMSTAKCSISHHLSLVKPVILVKLLKPRIVERYLMGTTFDDMSHWNLEGEPLIMEGEGTIEGKR